MQTIPVLSRTFYRIYWNNNLQIGVYFDFNDDLSAAFNQVRNGEGLPKNEVHFTDSYGTKYIHDKLTNTFKQS